ncbi:DUF3147 family protein [Amycolatopsis rhizosphaerae]|uniref:DUF3147 family protein n=2 Tax=Amycolatopsis rhizosphaerae TaxID=2053003 RepID=A0A558D508_9PSEU|nr:DUF3147 family protein [Amycolatopsis rhizosphaerae]
MTAHPADRVRFRPAALKDSRPRDWITRFGFGAGVSVVAGVVSVLAGPRVGGAFLAFPAILLASLTLVAKEEGVRQARNEARGATFGTLGLLAFALVTALTVGRLPLWLVFVAAVSGWALVALGAYLIARFAGAGGDEPPAG